MLDHVKKYRDIAAWVVLALVVGSMVFAVVRIVVTSVSTEYTLGQAALSYGESTLGLTPALIVLAVVALCVFLKPSSPSAPTLTLVAAIVVSAGTVLSLIFTFIGLSATLGGSIGVIFQLLGSMTDVILKALVAAALWLLRRGQQTGVVGSPLAANTPSAQASAPTVSPAGPGEPIAGSAWKSASDAAKGAPAEVRPESGASRQWRPVNRPPDETN
ncbi:hypothetical protein [Propionicicella superfundia]|uniref:hypothetical protein n=1 Tax=Propionicicella superfundia TaxID=348582 RepID=UPI0004215A6B|nr:hypothetical protein [Propionicicella superfundia]